MIVVFNNYNIMSLDSIDPIVAKYVTHIVERLMVEQGHCIINNIDNIGQMNAVVVIAVDTLVLESWVLEHCLSYNVMKQWIHF